MFSPPIRTILAVDSSAAAVSAAVLRDGNIRSQVSEPVLRGHGEVIMGLLKSVVAASGLSFAELDAVAVTEGPGSFTGIRVGLAAARGLALALDIPVFGVSTLLAHAAFVAPQAAERGARIMVVVDSKRADLFVQHFSSHLAPLDVPRLVGVDDLAAEIGETPVIVTGDAARLVSARPVGASAPHIVLPTGAPDIAVIARLAWLCDRPHTASPLYVRAPDATRPIAGGRLR